MSRPQFARPSTLEIVMVGNVIERGTLYFGNGFAYRRSEARQISYEMGREAQFAQAIRLTFTHKGHRKPSKQILTGGKLVIIRDWGHPTPPDSWAKGKRLGPISAPWGEVDATMHQTRYPLGDARWITEFNAFLENYIHRSGAQLVSDFRNHDFKDDHRHQIKKTDLTPDMPVMVTGVAAGQVVSVDQWPSGEIPAQEFVNFAEAREVFPDLDINRSSGRFEGPLVDTLRGRTCVRFDSLAVFERLSR